MFTKNRIRTSGMEMKVKRFILDVKNILRFSACMPREGWCVFSHSSLPDSSNGQGSGEMPVWPKQSLG